MDVNLSQSSLCYSLGLDVNILSLDSVLEGSSKTLSDQVLAVVLSSDIAGERSTLGWHAVSTPLKPAFSAAYTRSLVRSFFLLSACKFPLTKQSRR